jgi:O-antigen/teichoic acid export membrane protein
VLAGRYLPALRSLVELVYDPGFGVGYVFLSNLVANALYLPLLWRELSDFRFRLPQLAWLRPLLTYAYPLMLMGLAGMANEMLDRIVLKYWLPEGFYPNMSNQAALACTAPATSSASSCRWSFRPSATRPSRSSLLRAPTRTRRPPLLWCSSGSRSAARSFCRYQHQSEDFGLMVGPAFREGLVVVPILLLANLFLAFTSTCPSGLS